MLAAAGKALLLALATGLFCLGTCAPVLAPLMLGEERKGPWPLLLPFLQFSLGRLLAYAVVGAVAGWAGAGAAPVLTPRRVGASFLALAALMLLYGLKGGFPGWRLCRLAAPLLARLRAVGQWAAVIVGVFYLLAGLRLLIP